MRHMLTTVPPGTLDFGCLQTLPCPGPARLWVSMAGCILLLRGLILTFILTLVLHRVELSGGSPCISQPCLNNGTCKDHIRHYSCMCPPGYEGKNCAMAKNECHLERTDGCQHFCHPGQSSYMCSCAKGYKLGKDHKSCNPSDAGWRIGVRSTHVHMRYDEESGENDLSLLELEKPVQCPDSGLPVCVPERDFAERVLIPETLGLLSGWTPNGTSLDATPTVIPVTHADREECGQTLNVTVTTRTSCEKAIVVTGPWMEGSVVTRKHKGTWFLTGILGSTPPPGQSHVLLTTVPRYSMWFKQIMK
ncbi:vitamin K-dependent protein Z [Cricetulus griseus]|uniref:Vitamin K-dependent protein Z n=1 Tax=Cricetulus griseus TaxID=10029 RepID=A0A061IL91_CRIGR|nr:vitamin K-dependent protein Z [Cricetulus griseus]